MSGQPRRRRPGDGQPASWPAWPAALLIAVTAAGCGLLRSEDTEPVYQSGQSYFGRHEYIEYLAGDFPLIISAPHGGTLRPAEIPDRTWGSWAHDTRTEELARTFQEVFYGNTGRRPHIIICHLHRTKLDANRDREEAAQGSARAERAWHEFHGFIEAAKRQATAEYGRGFYIDLHGHGHAIGRLEWGYLISGANLALGDDILNGTYWIRRSSLRDLVYSSSRAHSLLLRGPYSLGTLLAERGYRSVPSSGEPDPQGEPYWSGGYNTARHGSRDGGTVSGVQLECHGSGVRDSAASRLAFAQALTEALVVYFERHLGIEAAAATDVAR
jgi:hypothetical protein